MSEIQEVKDEQEMSKFLIKHGEQIVDCLGAEVRPSLDTRLGKF